MCVVCFQRQYDWRAREHCRFNIGFWEKVVSKAAFAPEANSFGRNSITAPLYSDFEQFGKVAQDGNK